MLSIAWSCGWSCGWRGSQHSAQMRRAAGSARHSAAVPCAPPSRARKPFGDGDTKQARAAGAARQASYMRAMVPRGSVATYVDDGEEIVLRAHVRVGESLAGAAATSGAAPGEAAKEATAGCG